MVYYIKVKLKKTNITLTVLLQCCDQVMLLTSTHVSDTIRDKTYSSSVKVMLVTVWFRDP